MKFKDIKKMPKEESDKKLSDLRLELMKLQAQVAIGTTPKSTKAIREIKRALAKIETLRMQNFDSKIKQNGGKKKYISH